MTREELHGWLAVETAKEAHIFPCDLNDPMLLHSSNLGPRRATQTDLINLQNWQSILDADEQAGDNLEPLAVQSESDVLLNPSSSSHTSENVSFIHSCRETLAGS